MSLRHALVVCLSGVLLQTLPVFAGESDVEVDYGDAYSEPSYSTVALSAVQDALGQISATLDILEQEGALTAAGAQRLRLLIGGLAGSLELNATTVYGEDYATGGEYPAPQNGPTGDNGYYYKVTPSRQITLYDGSGSDNASATGETGKEKSVWIDEFGTVYVTGDTADPDSMQQLVLKPGWEQDYDQLSSQIEEMLAKFMAEHADEPSGDI